jgi:hypothetical protein
VVVAPPAGTAKGSECKDVHSTESPLSREPPAETEGLATHEASMLDIAVASRRRGTITQDAVCGLLTECLQDVSSTILVMPYLFACC